KQEEKRIEEEQAAKAQNWKLPVCYDDDDDEESSKSLKDNFISELLPYVAITPNEPIDSLSMGDEHLNTILTTKSDEFIKFSVENLVPNQSESEGGSECDVPAGFTTFSNVLFNADYDFDSIDDQSLSDEDFPEKIYSNPLFEEEINSMRIDQHHFNAESDLIESMLNSDSSIISSFSKNDSLLDEFASELTLFKSIPSRIDETDVILRKKLVLPRDCCMTTHLFEEDYDSGRDIPILKELLDNYSLSLPDNESYHFDIPSPYHPPAKQPDDYGDLSEAYQFQPPQYTVKHPIFNAHNDLLDSQNKLMEQMASMCEMVGQLIQKKQEEKQIQEDQTANARYWKIPACYDDEDDYNFAITPNEPVDSFIMEDEHLYTIPATESDEFIKSSVEDLVPNPSESEGQNECDLPACFTTFSNILFDAEYEFDSVDDQSLSDEDFSKEIFSPLFKEEINSMRIDQHHFNAESDLIESLLNHDSSIIPSSSKIDSLLYEFTGELTLLKSIPSGIDETDCHPENEIRLIKRLLYDNSSPRPPEEFVSENSYAKIESFSPSPIPIEDSDYLIEEIDLTFTPNDPMPPGIEKDDDDSRDILIHEELLDSYSFSLLENESFHFDIPSSSRPPAKPPDGNIGILNIKMMGDVSDQKVHIPRLTITLVSNQDKSPDLLSHRGFENFQPSAECPIMIHGKNIPILDVPLFHFYPLDQIKYGRN
nr:hypothetical protein [Tanacetum cinerariifolium]